MRFDEVELEAVPMGEVVADPEPEPTSAARWYKRLLALLTDVSLFAALSLALYPLLPPAPEWLPIAALAGFLVVVSYYYFVGTWLLWGKTIGGAIFDVKVVSTEREAMSLRSATLRWVGLYASLLTGGLGFLFSLPDRVSRTRCLGM